MTAEDSTLGQTPPHPYPDRAAVPRAAPLVVSWPWKRLALGAILVGAAILNVWRRSQVGYGNTCCGTSARAPGFGPADGGQQLYGCASRPSK